MPIRITINPDLKHVNLPRLALAGRRRELLTAMGRAVVTTTADHIHHWSAMHPNKLHGHRTHYWDRIADRITPATCLSVTADRAVFTLDGRMLPGINRAFGPVTLVAGTKTPGVKYLAIPLGAESYGHPPRTLPGLVVFWGGPGRALGLAQGIPVTRQRDTTKGPAGSTYLVPGRAMYWFVQRVTQPQDRTLLPDEAQWSAAATAAAKNFVNTLTSNHPTRLQA